MRFRLGPIPEYPRFDPEREGWSRLREPGPLAIQLIALPVALATLLASGALIFLVFRQAQLARYPSMFSLPAWVWLIVLVIVIPAHEAIHAALHPDWGLSQQSVIGLWPSKAVFYAHYEGAMSRSRLLLVLAGPYRGLSLLPIGLMAFPGTGAWNPTAVPLLAMLSVVGAVVACGDMISFALLVFLVPPAAVVRNQGWRTYWCRRPPGTRS